MSISCCAFRVLSGALLVVVWLLGDKERVGDTAVTDERPLLGEYPCYYAWRAAAARDHHAGDLEHFHARR